MKMSPNQRHGVRMIANGHKPRLVVIRALIERGLVRDENDPKLTPDGAYFNRYAELPRRG